jgi:hypothetical protein
MGDVIQFIPKSELERIRLIRKARAIYDSIFPPHESERRRVPPASRAIGSDNARLGERILT